MADKGSVELRAEPGKPTLVVSRVLDAPRRLVFDAWTNPEHLVHWWGWPNSTFPICEVDLRRGGSWRIVEKLQSGEVSTIGGTYLEVSPPERLRYTMKFVGRRRPAFTVEATFEPLGQRTRLTITSVFPSVKARNDLVAGGATKGSRVGMARLANHLRKIQSGPERPRTVRLADVGTVYDVPIYVVWKYMVSRQHAPAHRKSARFLSAKEVGPNSAIVTAERVIEGRWSRFVVRSTDYKPVGVVNEELEGPFAGSTILFLYSPRGRRTSVKVYADLASETIPRHRRAHVFRRLLESSYREDLPALTAFAKAQ